MMRTLAKRIFVPISALWLLGSMCEPAEAKLPPAGPNAIEVAIEAEPAGTLVMVDGSRLGNAPTKVKLNPGPHTIKGMKSGYFTAEQRVTVSSANPSPTVRLTLVASH